MLPRSTWLIAAMATGLTTWALAGITTTTRTDLLFQSEVGELPELWILPEASGQPSRFLPPGVAAFHPATASDGRVAFMRPSDGRQSLWLATPDGEELNRWSPADVDDHMPSFSPDGSRLAFVRLGAGGTPEVWVGPTRVNERLNLRPRRVIAGAMAPAWSPDGSRIAFASNRDGHFRIWTVAPDGSGLTRVTEAGAGDREPAWSPDGRRLVFVRQFENGAVDLVVRELRSGTERRVALSGIERRPAWSPDGRRIAFATDRHGELEIHTITPEGAQPRRLTHNTVRDQAPVWLSRNR
ncbi:MAG: TolB family protein [Gemmatimonadales bacterium]